MLRPLLNHEKIEVYPSSLSFISLFAEVTNVLSKGDKISVNPIEFVSISEVIKEGLQTKISDTEDEFL